MRVLFVTKPGIAPWLIRKWTWSDFSHVAMIVDDYVIQSTWCGGGVHKVSLEEFYKEYSTVEEVQIDLPDEDAAKHWLIQQLGKPYDVSFIFGFFFKRESWEEDDSWVCNELLEGACVVGGRRRIRGNIAKVSPQISYMISVDEKVS